MRNSVTPTWPIEPVNERIIATPRWLEDSRNSTLFRVNGLLGKGAQSFTRNHLPLGSPKNGTPSQRTSRVSIISLFSRNAHNDGCGIDSRKQFSTMGRRLYQNTWKEGPADKLNDVLNRVDDLLKRVDDLLNRVDDLLNLVDDLLNRVYVY